MLTRMMPARPFGGRRLKGLQYVFIALAMTASSAVPASAQIYLWRDANGNEVVSSVKRPPQGAPSKTYAVPESESVRTTNYVPVSRSLFYEDVIAEHAERNGLRPDLVRAVVQVESGFNPNARSPKGAIGLMQLMPGTARAFGVSNPYNPVENVRAGTAYLRQLLDRYDNNEELALAAYNAGPGAVDKYGETVPPYRETKNYVSKIGKISSIQRLPGTHIYKVTKIIDGREIVFFTDKKPSTTGRPDL